MREATAGGAAAGLPSLPPPVVMLLVTLGLGLFAGMGTNELFRAPDAGFGAALGEYALILIPSFTLAAALTAGGANMGSGRIATLLAPFAGAAMVCPDTAYAALSPMAGSHKLAVLFGAYAGFKLLVPAGPAIVATALGGFDASLAITAVPVFLAAWTVGLLYARHVERSPAATAGRRRDRVPLRLLAPLLTLIGLLATGFLPRGHIVLPCALDFLLSPKGALLAAAVVSLVPLSGAARSAAIDIGMRRTAPLLRTIGAASALGAMLVAVLPIARWAAVLVSSGLVLPALFAFTASFKLAKGSSMATFAGTSGIVAALLPTLQVSPTVATLAMCAGAFVTIAPNDSLYWLVRQDALAGRNGAAATRLLTVGGLLQGLAALLAVEALVVTGLAG